MADTKVLILCTGNSCRSQMAEGFLRSFAKERELEVYSAGTKPAEEVNPLAIKVMGEAGIDISRQLAEDVGKYLDREFDWVITVCDNARETCPVFSGKVAHRIHMGYEDPAKATGTIDEQLKVYRAIRDQIREGFLGFYKNNITK